MRLDQAVNLTCGGLEILLVVIPLGVTRLKKTGFLYLLDLFGGRREKGWCDLVYVFGMVVYGMVLVLWGVGVNLRRVWNLRTKLCFTDSGK